MLTQFLLLRIEPQRFALEFSTSALLTAQVWAFLAKSGEYLTKGTKQLFPPSDVPSDLSEIFADGVDECVKEVGLPGITPLMHIIRAILHKAREKEIRSDESDAAWTEFRSSAFLLAYFAWWTNGDRYSVVKAVVDEGDKQLLKHRKDTDDLICKIHDYAACRSRFSQEVGAFLGAADDAA